MSTFLSLRSLGFVTLTTIGAGCSGGSERASNGTENAGSGGDASGGSGGVDSAGGSGGVDSAGASGGASGATPAGGSAGASGAAGADQGQPAGSCSATRTLEAGKTYGEYTLFAIRVDLELAAGNYSVRVPSGGAGAAQVYRGLTLVGEFEYDASASLEENAEQTIAFEGFFELDLRSQTRSDLSGLDQSIFDGCHVISVVDRAPLVAGRAYGPYLVAEVTVDAAAPSGTYTFFAESGNVGQVELRLDGVAVDTLIYAWMTTVGGGQDFTFTFPGVVSFVVTRSMGTSNLFGLADNLFDGRHELSVP